MKEIIYFLIFSIRNGYAELIWREVPDKIKDSTERSSDAMINA